MQVIHHGREIGDLRRLAIRPALRAAQGRRIAEVELAVIQIGHARQAFAQGIDADDIGIHLAHAHGEGIDLLLQDALDLFDLRLLPEQVGRPAAELIDGVAGAVASAQTHANGESAAHDTQHEEHGCTHDDGMTEVKLLHSARLTADKNDIHADYSSYAVIALNRCITSYGRGRLCPVRWR